MIRPPDNLKTMIEKRVWLERELPIPDEIKRSLAYRTLTDESKIVLMLMMDAYHNERSRPPGAANAPLARPGAQGFESKIEDEPKLSQFNDEVKTLIQWVQP